MAAAETCHANGARIETELETTREEIVGVDVQVADRALHDCVTERVWDTFLAIPNAPEHTFTRFVI